MANVDDALAWASGILPELKGMLHTPFAEHGTVSALIPQGGLRKAHVIGLVRLVKIKGGLWKSTFAGLTVTIRGAALQFWLFNLIGGVRAGVRSPTSCGRDSSNSNASRNDENEEKSWVFAACRALVSEHFQRARAGAFASLQPAQPPYPPKRLI